MAAILLVSVAFAAAGGCSPVPAAVQRAARMRAAFAVPPRGLRPLLPITAGIGSRSL